MTNDVDASTVTAREFCEMTGASYRQIDYWIRNNVFFPVTGTGTGSGVHRQFNANDVGPVTTLVIISNNLKGSLTTEILSQVFDAYDDGVLYLGDGLELRWEIL